MPAKNPITSNIVLDATIKNMLEKLKKLPEFRQSKSAVVRTALIDLYIKRIGIKPEESLEWGVYDESLTVKVPIVLHVDPSVNVVELLKSFYKYFTEQTAHDPKALNNCSHPNAVDLK
jgi:hypothetical protein